MLAAVERRLRADVPVVSYLSGGVDSSIVVALACKVRGRPIPTFTIRDRRPELDETSEAAWSRGTSAASRSSSTVGADEVLQTYPRADPRGREPGDRHVVRGPAAAGPARCIGHGYKVALTGEGADEWLAGYPWYKVHKLLGYLDVIPACR